MKHTGKVRINVLKPLGLLFLVGSLLAVMLLAGCTAPPTTTPPTTAPPATTTVAVPQTTSPTSAGCTEHLQDGKNAVMTTLTNIRDLRYCEISLICGTGPGTASMYNTKDYNKQPGHPLDTCPDALWNGVSESATATQFNVQSSWKNGPRFWTVDTISIPMGVKLNFNGLEAIWFAYPGYPPNVQNLGITAGSYVITKVQRDSKMTFDAGKPIFILDDPSGTPYVMQAACMIVDPTLTYKDLFNLSPKLQNPPGWSYRVKVIDQPLTIQAINGVATITQDSLGNSYNACYSESGQSTCSFMP